MGRVTLKDLDVTGLLKRYYTVGDERPVSDVLSGKKSRNCRPVVGGRARAAGAER